MGPLLGRYHTAIYLTQGVSPITNDALYPDVGFPEPLALHRFHRIAQERLHHADLPSFYELLPPWSCHGWGTPFSSFC
jgi:hypothetical protein